jgi:6-phosphogluconolactonase (cycloisomerase 2 family)
MRFLRVRATLVPAALCAAVTGCAQSAVTPGGASAPGTSGALSSAVTKRSVVEKAAAGDYLYVENGDNTLSAFAVAKNGALSPVTGSPFDSNTNSPGAFAIAIDPKGPYLYTTGSVSNNIAQFSIGAGGVLSLVSSSTNGEGSPGFTTLSKSDGVLYVADTTGGGSIGAFSVQKGSGALTALKGSPFPVSCPGFCTSSPDYAVADGAYLYTVDTYGFYVSTFSVSKKGALTELNSYATHYGPTAAVLTPNGDYLYVTNGASANISAYAVAGGVLTQLTGSPFGAGGQPQGIAITPNGKYVYVANYGDGTISGYSVGSGGALVQLSGSPFADGAGTAPTAITIDKAGKTLSLPTRAPTPSRSMRSPHRAPSPRSRAHRFRIPRTRLDRAAWRCTNRNPRGSAGRTR